MVFHDGGCSKEKGPERAKARSPNALWLALGTARRLCSFERSSIQYFLKKIRLVSKGDIKKRIAVVHIVYRMKMPLAKKLSLKFYIFPRNENVCLSAVGIVLQYTSHRERFIYWIIHAFAFSLTFPSYFRCLHPLMRLRLFQKKQQQQQQRQKKKPALLRTGTYMFVNH